MSSKKKERLMRQLKKQLNNFNATTNRNLSLASIDASVLNQITDNNKNENTTEPIIQKEIIYVPVTQGRKTMLGGLMGALGGNGGAGAGVLGAGAGLAMATMGADKEKKELRQKQIDQRDSEFGLLMVMQNRHRALTKVEGEVRFLDFVNYR